VALFPPGVGRPKWSVLVWAWKPQDTLLEHARKDRAPYDIWASRGLLQTTSGSRVDYGVVRQTLLELRDRFTIEAVGFDPYHADSIIRELVEQDGFNVNQVLTVGQTFRDLSAACKNIEAEVLEGAIDANGHPVMSWCVSNAVVQRDGKDNIQPIKKRSRGRIDAVTALCIARRLAIQHVETHESAVWVM
jgi:phage terminase large subunit-like protein